MPIRAVIIGAGLMGSWHAHTIKKLGAELVAVVDDKIDSATELCRRFGGKAFSSLNEVTAKVEFDVLHICTPLGSHFPLAQQALKADKHVIVEKPLVDDLSEFKVLQQIAQEKRRLICPVHQFAFQRGVLEAKHIIQERAPHKPSAVVFDFASAGGQGKPASQLNTIIVEILPHPLSILQKLFPEEPLAVERWQHLHEKAGELITIGSHAGVPVIIKMSMSARPTHSYLTIYHASGAIHVNLFHGYAVKESPVVSRITKITQPFVLGLKTLNAAFVNLIRRALTGESAYPGLRCLINDCYAAIEQQSSALLSIEQTAGVIGACKIFQEKLNVNY